MPTPIVRAGLIGAGMIAQVMHLPYLAELRDRFELTALCDLSPGTAKAVAEQYNIPQTYTDHRDMLGRADLDAVLVLTGNHARPAIDAARAGKHILVEKPMCNNLDEAAEMIDAVEAAGVVGMVAHHKRYDPGYRLGQRAIHALEEPHLVHVRDIIGPNAAFLGHYDIVRVDDLDAAVIDRLQAEQAAAYRVAIGEQPDAILKAYRFLLGLNTHDMTILHGAVGLPERILAADIWKDGLAIAALFGFAGELRGTFETAVMPRLTKFDESLKVYAADRVVDIQFPSPFLKNAPTIVEEWCMEDGAYQERRSLASYEEAFKQELIHFHECIVSGMTPETTLAEARDDIAVLIQIVEAAVR